MEPRPIETCPRDAYVFLYFPPCMEWWGRGYADGVWAEYNGWESLYVHPDGHYHHAQSVLNKPTHWLPALPVPE